jgi:tetratricopeptide (TPR) repeat protein
LERFSRAIEFDEQKATYYNNKALALYHLGDLKGSLAEYNRAIVLDETDARTLYNRGNTYLALGNNEEAHADFD